MSFVTARGLRITDQDIGEYFATHPGEAQIAREAATLGLSAGQIANAVSLGRGIDVTGESVREWVDSHLAGAYRWDASGVLAATDPAETLAIVSTTTDANPDATTNTLVLSTTAYTALNISGDVALDLSPDWAISLMSVEAVDASTFDAGLHIYMYGNTHNLSVKVGEGNDIVVAGFGNDTIATGAGDDIIFAGRAGDSVDAGAGNDWIRGGPGRDVMAGGTGSDTFAYVFVYESQGTATDVITDFQAGAGGDVLDFRGLTHGVAPRTVFDAASSTLYLDIDGDGVLDGVGDMAIQLTGVTGGLTPENFIF